MMMNAFLIHGCRDAVQGIGMHKEQEVVGTH